jgi:hypothetical protein
MINSSTRITMGENALMQKVSDEMVILDSQSGQYFTLNDSATEILEALSGASVEQVVTQICANYDVSAQEAQADITAMIQTLLDKALLCISNPE